MVWTQQHPTNGADYNGDAPDCKSLMAGKPAKAQKTNKTEQTASMAKLIT
jgi:hypothetical protein